jgi:hypothetical protein
MQRQGPRHLVQPQVRWFISLVVGQPVRHPTVPVNRPGSRRARIDFMPVSAGQSIWRFIKRLLKIAGRHPRMHERF